MGHYLSELTTGDIKIEPAKPGSLHPACSTASFKCKWCGTTMQDIRATSVNNTARPVRGFGLCPKCEALVWSKPLEDETPQNAGDERRPEQP